MKITIEQIEEAIIKQKELAGEFFSGWYEEEISYALRVLKKLMEEPSEDMLLIDDSGFSEVLFDMCRADDYAGIFKAMRNQLLKEVGE